MTVVGSSPVSKTVVCLTLFATLSKLPRKWFSGSLECQSSRQSICVSKAFLLALGRDFTFVSRQRRLWRGQKLVEHLGSQIHEESGGGQTAVRLAFGVSRRVEPLVRLRPQSRW